MPIVTLTLNPSVDVNADVEQVVPNRKLRCGQATYEAGGGGINVARAIQRLGGSALAMFTSGGISGQRIESLLEAEGVAVQPLRISGETRETLNVTESSSDNQFRFVMEGPTLEESDWEGLLAAVRALDPAPEFLIASGSLPPGVPADFYGRLSAIAAKTGSKLIVDTSGAALQHAAGEGTFLLKPNLNEVRELAGGKPFSDVFLEGMARSLVAAKRAKVVAVSMGAAGSLVVWEGGATRVVAPTVPVVSRVGAGDSMVAGTVVALTRGMPIEEAVRYGVAAGTAAVMTPGTELCRRDDTDRLYEQMRATSSGAASGR